MEAMVFQSYSMGSSSASDIYRLFNPTSLDDRLIGGSINGVLSSGELGMASLDSLVLHDEKGELVKSPAGSKKCNKVSEAKALAALKNHSEAERRRRERINGHLATLRGLVPSTAKMDKATLLAEVISQVKELKKNAMEASKGFLIPMETDEVKVEPYDDEAGQGSMAYKASICCGYRPELLSDLRQTFDALQLQLVRTELSTLGERVKNEFVYTCCYKGAGIDIEACQVLASNVHKALSSVLEKDLTSQSLEYNLRTEHPPSKRRRLGFIDTSNVLCNHECCSC